MSLASVVIHEHEALKNWPHLAAYNRHLPTLKDLVGLF